MTELVTTDLVDLDLAPTDRRAVVRSLSERLNAAGRVTDLEQFVADVEAREAKMATGLPGGIGIPHCRSEAVTVPTVAVGRSAGGVDFGADDGPARLIFLIAAPEGGDTDHMTVLASLARLLMRAEFTETLRNATDPAVVAEYVRTEVTP